MAPINTEVGYRFIRDRILSGAYAPGHPLLTLELAKEIGISRTPVRDALRQLEADGLVTIQPRLGAAVKSMDLQEFRDLCGLRQNLEGYAAELAALSRSEAELAEMLRALEAMAAITDRMLKTREEPEQLQEMRREDMRFHHAIVTASKNEFLKREILRLHLVDRVVSVRPVQFKSHFGFGGPDVRRKALRDHQRIYDAVAGRNAAAAREAMEFSLQDLIDYSLRMKVIEDRSEFQNDLGLVSRKD